MQVRQRSELCAAAPPRRAVQRFGLRLMWLLLVLGRNHRALAEQDLPTPMAQTLVDAVIGPAALTHIGVGVRMQVWVSGRRLDLVSLVGFLRFVWSFTAPSVLACSDPHQGRKSRGELDLLGWAPPGLVRASDLGHLRHRPRERR